MASPRGLKNVYSDRALLPAGVKQWRSKFLTKVIYKEGYFNFRPYVFIPARIHNVQMFEEITSEIALAPRSLVSPKLG